jgi:hypothetical protein
MGCCWPTTAAMGFSQGVPDDRWDNDDLHELQERIHGSDFEAVDRSTLISDPDSGQAARATEL